MFFQIIESDIARYSQIGKCLVFGDFNGRTSTESTKKMKISRNSFPLMYLNKSMWKSPETIVIQAQSIKWKASPRFMHRLWSTYIEWSCTVLVTIHDSHTAGTPVLLITISCLIKSPRQHKVFEYRRPLGSLHTFLYEIIFLSKVFT